MSTHVFWPPLAVLAMLVMVVIFLILKYGGTLLRARTVPKSQNYEIENQSSENTTFDVDERSFQMTHYDEDDEDEEEEEEEEDQYRERSVDMIMPVKEKAYEYAV